ncbi:hypothetical protein ABEB36_010620 [Hypothenemus hampei]|uniref:Uncharacterized protein n=1 Tax=Hypothenemus hampei TaxID=57062 RepID=A0ABD1EEM7_HYPHA
MFMMTEKIARYPKVVKISKLCFFKWKWNTPFIITFLDCVSKIKSSSSPKRTIPKFTVVKAEYRFPWKPAAVKILEFSGITRKRTQDTLHKVALKFDKEFKNDFYSPWFRHPRRPRDKMDIL